MKGKSTKSALLMSFTSLLLCFAMLIGTTFAWFTDSVTSGVNRIVAGNLDVDVTHSNAKVTDTDVKGEDTMFPDRDGNAMLWEPGAMSYENFTVKNVGTLALKYNMSMNVVDFNAVSGTGDNLKDALKVKVLTDSEILSNPTREAVAALDWTNAQTLEEFKKDGGKLYPSTDTTNGHTSEEKFQVIVYWQPTDNDNRWNLNNGKQNTDGYKIGDEEALYINFGVTVAATQLEHESDSFDNQYDKTAEAPSIVMPTWSGESAEVELPATGNAAKMEVKVNNEVRATATVDAGTKINGAALEENETLKLTIEPDDAPNGITVETGNSVTTYDVSLVKVVTTTETEDGETTKEDVKVTAADKPVLVSLDIGIVDLVDFYHHGERLEKVGSKEAITGEGMYWYDQTSGTVYFKTMSFSPFASVYKFAGGLGTEQYPYLLANGEHWYSLIEDYNGEYIDNIHVKLIGDLDMENYDLNDYVTYPNNFSLDGNGHKFTNLNSTIWGYYGYYYGTCEIKDLAVEDSYAKYSLFGYGPGTSYADQTVNVTNVTVKNCETNGGTFMYYTGAGHINFTNCVVENSLVHGPSNMGGGGFVGNGQGITINNCKFGGSIVAESTNMVAGFVGQGKAIIKNSEVTSGTVIRSIAAGGNVAAYDGQGGGGNADDHNVFNGTLCCDTEAKASKQNSGAVWVKYEGLKASDFQLAEDGTITFVGENQNFSSATISEYIFQRSDYYKNGNSGQSGTNAYLLGGYSCYWEDLIHVDSITSNTLYKVDRVKNIVNVVSEEYANKIACATADVPNVAWTRYYSYLDRETGTLYYDGRYSTNDYCGFIGDSATVTADGTMTPKTTPKGDFNIVIKCFDEHGGVLGSVTLSYSVNFTSDPA